MASKNTPRHGRTNIKPSTASSADNSHDATSPEVVADKNTDTFGLAAQELPDGGRGSPETDPGKELGRALPQEHGGELGAEGGLRADRQFGGRRIKGSPKKN